MTKRPRRRARVKTIDWASGDLLKYVEPNLIWNVRGSVSDAMEWLYDAK